MDELIESGGICNKYTSTGRHSGYQVDLYHSGLDEHKHLSAVEHSALLGKIHNQANSWQEKWEKEQVKQRAWNKKNAAEELTKRAQAKIQKIEKILEHTLSIDDAIDWETLKHKDEFRMNPIADSSVDYIAFDKKNGFPKKVTLKRKKAIPKQEKFFSKISFFQKLLGQENKIRANQQEEFDKAIAVNKIENEEVRKENIERKAELEAKQNQWEKEKVEFEEAQNEHNTKVEELESQYQNKNVAAIVEYCEMVLNNSEYSGNFPQEFDLQYNETNGMLLIDYQLPSIDDMPTINNVRYIKSRDVIEEKMISQTAIAKLYNTAVYQIALRTIHELFEADTINALEAINLNGLVTATNPATGHEETSCIISVQTKKDAFEMINLEGIVNSQTYKECFKSLKGVGSTKLSTMTAVKPLLELNKSDRRFRDHYEVADGLNDQVNIAAMGWEDFEHLVREIFQKEFTENGGEVKVTQASADGGVDAIAFDPDPLRGGKIVIQAKRYTNVVGVAAVRDLYGTVMNEGATKGILVTTSDYGSDSYDFAKNKPITLLNGSNLLHLLEKHGHQAKIDIREAKKMLKEQAC
jgi:restriction system protein